MTKLYMAYGSNLNMANMSSRCPDAKLLGSMYIPKWKLVFRHVADIVPTYDKEDLLPVGLWEITEDLGESSYKIRQSLRDKLEDAIALQETSRL